MIIIADTSPINYLVLIDEIQVLPKLFGQIVVPQAVWTELHAEGSPPEVKAWIASNPPWVKIEAATLIDQTIMLGAGECEAISLAKEVSADLVLIDDRKARQAALDRGIKVAGTINVLENGAQRGLLDLSVAFSKLQQTNFRVAPKLLQEILDRQ